MTPKLPLFLLFMAALIAASCAARDSSPAQGAPHDPASPPAADPAGESLSDEAAAAFSKLPALHLADSPELRTFRIVPAQSTASYVVDEEFFAAAKRKYGLEPGKAKVVGSTRDVSGILQIDPSDPSIGPNRFAVYLPTLRTDQKLRDGWIRENALESDRYPVALFVAASMLDAPLDYREGETVRFQLQGDLTLRGLTLPALWSVEANLGQSTIAGSLETRLSMTDLGFDPPNFANTLTVQNEFTIRIDFVATEL